MCGRTVCHLAPGDIQSACKYRNKEGKLKKPDWKEAPNGKKYFPSYNIAPGAHTPVLLSGAHFNTNGDSSGRVIQPMLWGLIPSWHKGSVGNKAYETNNCRAESMMEKQTYKVPLQKGRRCVILAEGFYEWKRDKATKQPYYIYSPQRSVKQENENGFEKELNFESSKCESKSENCDSQTAVQVKYEADEVTSQSLKCENPITSETVKCEAETVKCEAEIVKCETDTIKCEAGTVKCEAEQTCERKTDPISVKFEPKEDSWESDINHDQVTEEESPPLLMMAGVFDVWQPNDGSEPVFSYSVITVESSSAMAWLHHRMPAILSTDSEVEEWLNFGEVPITKAIKLIQSSQHIELHPVSTFVNNSRNNSPECVKKIDPSKPKQTASSYMMKAWLTKGQSPGKTQSSITPSSTETKKKTGSSISSMMMSWLSKGRSPVKTEHDSKRRKLD